jgi:hypothetical protein
MSARDLPQLLFDEETHTYRLGGRVLPGVTRIIEPLRSWEGVPLDVLERKSALGTAVHMATHFHDKGTLDESSLTDEVRGYLEGWRRFLRENAGRVKLQHRELKVCHRALGFAGTLDVEMLYDGDLEISDLKSGMKHRVHGVQVAGYALARMHEQGWTNYPKRSAIYLFPDGRYERVPYTKASDYPTFLSMLNLTNWRSAP